MAKEDVGTTRDYTPTDTGNSQFNWVLCRVSGSLVIEGQLGAVNTLTAVPANVWVPVGNAIRITTASTAAGIMVF